MNEVSTVAIGILLEVYLGREVSESDVRKRVKRAEIQGLTESWCEVDDFGLLRLTDRGIWTLLDTHAIHVVMETTRGEGRAAAIFTVSDFQPFPSIRARATAFRAVERLVAGGAATLVGHPDRTWSLFYGGTDGQAI